MSADRRESVAVIGAGVSGLTAAYLLRHTHDVTLFEAAPRLGGHAHTHQVPTRLGDLPVDSGFIVHNERTYPHLLRLFGELGVTTRPTEMSMSITCEACGLSYAGGRGARGLLAQPARAASPRYLRMLSEVPRFHRMARRLLDDPNASYPNGTDPNSADPNSADPNSADPNSADPNSADPNSADANSADANSADPNSSGPTWGQFLADGGFSDYFISHFAIPLVACVWSSGDTDARQYPARHLFTFLDHHGMLSITGSPTWRTVDGGSANYVGRIAERLPDVRTGVGVTAVRRHADGVEIRTADGALAEFDRVVVAVHADLAAAMLVDATVEEKTDLSSIPYSTNPTWLHRDPSVLPTATGARASWNYRIRDCSKPAQRVLVSYWMNLLHGYTGAEDLVVTLNPDGWVDPSTVIAEMTYTHPVFTPAAVAAAARLRTAGGPRLAFAGAHLGWGFHEDGCRSGVEAAESFGVTW